MRKDRMSLQRLREAAEKAKHELSSSLDVQLKKAKGAYDTLLPKINVLLKAAGLDPIVPSTNEPPKQRPNVAM